jgi:cytochrome c biogenesis protein CcmG, thiol:disulfide interchange protein DsbE
MRLLAAMFAVTFITGCGGPSPRVLSAITASEAAPLPSLSYRLVSGQPWTSEAARGRVIVLDVWATYCQPCRKAFPKLSRLAAAHPDVVVIGVSVDEDDAVVDAFLRDVPAGFPIARDPAQSVQSGPLAIQSLPTVLVVDRRGRIRLRAEQMAETDYDALPGVIAALQAE